MRLILCLKLFFIFFFNDTATTEIYTLSLHDALPILYLHTGVLSPTNVTIPTNLSLFKWIRGNRSGGSPGDRKSTRLNSSHLVISYAVFCLKKKSELKVLPSAIPIPFITGSTNVIVDT